MDSYIATDFDPDEDQNFQSERAIQKSSRFARFAVKSLSIALIVSLLPFIINYCLPLLKPVGGIVVNRMWDAFNFLVITTAVSLGIINSLTKPKNEELESDGRGKKNSPIASFFSDPEESKPEYEAFENQQISMLRDSYHKRDTSSTTSSRPKIVSASLGNQQLQPVTIDEGGVQSEKFISSARSGEAFMSAGEIDEDNNLLQQDRRISRRNSTAHWSADETDAGTIVNSYGWNPFQSSNDEEYDHEPTRASTPEEKGLHAVHRNDLRTMDGSRLSQSKGVLLSENLLGQRKSHRRSSSLDHSFEYEPRNMLSSTGRTPSDPNLSRKDLHYVSALTEQLSARSRSTGRASYASTNRSAGGSDQSDNAQTRKITGVRQSDAISGAMRVQSSRGYVSTSSRHGEKAAFYKPDPHYVEGSGQSGKAKKASLAGRTSSDTRLSGMEGKHAPDLVGKLESSSGTAEKTPYKSSEYVVEGSAQSGNSKKASLAGRILPDTSLVGTESKKTPNLEGKLASSSRPAEKAPYKSAEKLQTYFDPGSDAKTTKLSGRTSSGSTLNAMERKYSTSAFRGNASAVQADPYASAKYYDQEPAQTGNEKTRRRATSQSCDFGEEYSPDWLFTSPPTPHGYSDSEIDEPSSRASPAHPSWSKAQVPAVKSTPVDIETKKPAMSPVGSVEEVGSSPNEVNRKADAFIAKVREQMRMQRAESYERYRQRLARGF